MPVRKSPPCPHPECGKKTRLIWRHSRNRDAATVSAFLCVDGHKYRMVNNVWIGPVMARAGRPSARGETVARVDERIPGARVYLMGKLEVVA
jgi:hypothetical protein